MKRKKNWSFNLGLLYKTEPRVFPRLFFCADLASWPWGLDRSASRSGAPRGQLAKSAQVLNALI